MGKTARSPAAQRQKAQRSHKTDLLLGPSRHRERPGARPQSEAIGANTLASTSAGAFAPVKAAGSNQNDLRVYLGFKLDI
jgi:hypothetical protein